MPSFSNAAKIILGAAMSLGDTDVYVALRTSSYSGPKNAKGAINEPVLTPVTALNVGRVPF